MGIAAIAECGACVRARVRLRSLPFCFADALMVCGVSSSVGVRKQLQFLCRRVPAAPLAVLPLRSALLTTICVRAVRPTLLLLLLKQLQQPLLLRQVPPSGVSTAPMLMLLLKQMKQPLLLRQVPPSVVSPSAVVVALLLWLQLLL